MMRTYVESLEVLECFHCNGVGDLISAVVYFDPSILERLPSGQPLVHVGVQALLDQYLSFIGDSLPLRLTEVHEPE